MVRADRDLSDGFATELKPEGRAAFYKQRLQLAERELADVQLWIDKGLASQADVHAAQWEARRREADNAELRKALSDAHVSLWEEREARRQVEAQNDEIKLRELETRRLFALAQPVMQEVTNFHGQTPDGFTRPPHAAGGAGGAGGPASAAAQRRLVAQGGGRPQTARRADGVEKLRVGGGDGRPGARLSVGAGYESEEADGGGHDVSLRGLMLHGQPRSPAAAPAARRGTLAYAAPAGRGEAGGRIVRTVYMPNERVDALSRTVECLRAQLRQHEQLAAERVSALLEDRREREAQAARAGAALASAQHGALSQLQQAQEALGRTTRDYLTLRADASQRQSRDADKIDSLQAELSSAKAQLKGLLEKAAQQMRAAAARSGGADGALRARLASAEEANALLEEKHAALHLAASARAAALEAQAGRLRAELAKLQERRQLDLEGFAAEAAQLRRALDRCERAAGARQRRGPRAAEPGAAAAEGGELDPRVLRQLRERLEQLEADLGDSAGAARRRVGGRDGRGRRDAGRA